MKIKKTVSINLQKGRDKLKIKQEQQRKERELRKEELENVKKETILRKAQKIKEVQQSKINKTKTKIDKVINIPLEIDENKNEIFDEEEIIITKKPKKKKIIYREESDSEEEVIVKKLPKQKPVVNKMPLLQFF